MDVKKTVANLDEVIDAATAMATPKQSNAGRICLGVTASECFQNPGTVPLQNTDETISLKDSSFFGLDWTTLQSLFTGVFNSSIPFVKECDASLLGGAASLGDAGVEMVQSGMPKRRFRDARLKQYSCPATTKGAPSCNSNLDPTRVAAPRKHEMKAHSLNIAFKTQPPRSTDRSPDPASATHPKRSFKMKTNLIYALALTGLVATSLQAQPVLQDGVLTDPAGKTLYIFDKDQPGKSNCSGACLQAWPAYTTGTGPAKLPEVSRLPGDGSQQWTWNKMPLYYFAGDAKPGDRTGDGSGGVWHLVKRNSPATATPASSY